MAWAGTGGSGPGFLIFARAFCRLEVREPGTHTVRRAGISYGGAFKEMKIKGRGFTLIELLVVVLIIGILASVSIPQYFKLIERSRVAEAKSIFGAVKSAQTRVMAKNGSFTDSWDTLDVTFSDSSGVPCAGPAACVQRMYTYMLDTNGNIYAVRNAEPKPPSLYGNYTLIHEIESGNTTCTQANCIMDLL